MKLEVSEDAKQIVSFGDIITDQKKIIYLLNYRFSKLGEYIRSKQKTFEEIETRVKAKTIRFRISTKNGLRYKTYSVFVIFYQQKPDYCY